MAVPSRGERHTADRPSAERRQIAVADPGVHEMTGALRIAFKRLLEIAEIFGLMSIPAARSDRSNLPDLLFGETMLTPDQINADYLNANHTYAWLKEPAAGYSLDVTDKNETEKKLMTRVIIAANWRGKPSSNWFGPGYPATSMPAPASRAASEGPA